jgi:hypothetical protein
MTESSRGSGVAASPWSRRGVAAAFVVAVVFLAFFFHGGIFPNATSRALTVLGLTEQGTMSADPWTGATSDYATVNGHTYSDKAPLASFVVLPVYFAWSLVRGRPYAHPLDLKILVLTGDVVAAAIPFAAFVLLLERRAARVAGHRLAAALALVGAFGTPLFNYAGTYYGHVLSGTLLVFAYDAATREGGSWSEGRRAALAGFLAGLAVLAELPAAIGTALLGAYLVSRPSWPRLLLLYAAGGLPCAIALGAYDLAITGSPFDPPYHHLPPAFVTEHPYVYDLHTFVVAGRLLFGQYRGLFFWAPALLVAIPLAVVRAPGAARRALFVALVVLPLAFVASFWMWSGGWCVGPRHLTGLVMIALNEGVQAVASVPRARLPFLVLGGAGVLVNLIADATNRFVPVEPMHPFTELYWPSFLAGDVTRNNVLTMLGLHAGRASVALWLVLFVAAILLLGRLAEERERAT